MTIRERLMRDLARDPGILILAYPYARTWREIPLNAVYESWSRVNEGEQATLYVHIPFCHRKCAFCGFLSYYNRPQSEIERYMEFVDKEIKLVSNLAGHVVVEVVHLGGGTPSLLSTAQVASLLENISSSFCLSHGTTVTMEVFPDSYVTKEQLAGWKEAGINRLSFGIQFFDDELKKALNRTDSTADNLRILKETEEVGFDRVNIDLMCGLADQDMDSWNMTLSQSVGLAPESICVFPVSIRHPGIPLFKRKSSSSSVSRTRQMYNEAVRRLTNAGYERMTRHNFVRCGTEYQYEQMMAELAPLIGLGANSISYSRDCIYRNHSDLARYASAVSRGELPVRAGHLFPEEERPHNYAVRRIEYLRLSGEDFQREFGAPLKSVFDVEIELLEETGLAHLTDGDLLLTEEGIYFTSAVKRTFFHHSAWERFESMSPEEFKIERGTLEPMVSQ